MNTPQSQNQWGYRLRYVQITVTLLSLAPVIAGLWIFLSRYLGGDREQITVVLVPVFGLATVLGIAALVTLAAARGSHFVMGVLFFGGLAGMAFVNIASEALAGRDYGSTARAVGQYGLMSACMLLALVGLYLEIIGQRRAVGPNA